MSVLEDVKKIKSMQDKGEMYFLPCLVNRFNKDFMGIDKDDIVIVTGATSSSKTQFTKFIFVFKAIESAIKYDVKFKVLYFCLEEAYQQFVHSVTSYLLYQEYGLRYNTIDFSGRRIDNNGDIIPVSEELLNALEKVQPLVDKYMSYIKVYANTSTPGHIYKAIKEYASTKIKFYKNGLKLDISQVEKNVEYDKVERDEELVNCIIDHVSLVYTPSKDKYNSVEELCYYMKNYVQKLFSYNIIYVQQQNSDHEGLQNIKNDTYYATMEALANFTATKNDALTIIGITSPSKYSIKTWHGYSVEKLDSLFKVVQILKHRYSRVGFKYPFYHDGKTNNYFVLPKTNESDKLNEIYEKVEELD